MHKLRDWVTGNIKSLADAVDVKDIYETYRDAIPMTDPMGDKFGIRRKAMETLYPKEKEPERKKKVKREAARSILEREKKYTEDYVKYLDNNPDIQGMLLWEQQNPVNLWNPLTWDFERVSDLATTGALEVLSNIGIAAGDCII